MTKKPPRPAHPPKRRETQLQFLRQSARLEESTAPYMVRGAMAVLSSLVVAFIAWAHYAEIEEITQAPGEVVTSGFTQIIQHYDGGIVEEILVREGTEVERGAMLLRIDGAGAQQELNKARIAAEGLQQAADTAEEMYAIQSRLKREGVSTKLRYLEARQARNQALSELHQQQQVITRLEARVSRLHVHAPVAGLVKGLKLNTIGEVITPGAPLMEIVPTAESLVVEARISPNDIGHIAIGQPVKVKVSSFDYGRFGTVDGVVELITATTFENQKGAPYYRSRVRLNQHHIGRHEHMKILPGMTVQAGIITGEKSIMAYLLKPVQRALADGFSEK